MFPSSDAAALRDFSADLFGALALPFLIAEDRYEKKTAAPKPMHYRNEEADLHEMAPYLRPMKLLPPIYRPRSGFVSLGLAQFVAMVLPPGWAD
jgi:hypothetical protein